MSTVNLTDDIETLYVAVCDLNGNFRGKRIPHSKLESALAGSIRMPTSITSVDIWGADIEEGTDLFSSGDTDGICLPTERGLLKSTWQKNNSALLPLWMCNDDGTPSNSDPRQALASVVNKYKAKGLTPVVATELEFFLVDATGNKPQAPISPVTGDRLDSTSILSLTELEHFEAFLTDVYDACKQQNIPADAAIAENGCGQFEVNLLHINDPLKAADDAVFFKRIVKAVARKHDMVASFMAKPFGDQSGNGFHLHFSLLNEAGENVFDDGTEEGSEVLLHAVAGLIESLPKSMLIFAPNFNSYRRFAPGSHAPTTATWGYENRTAAIRIPGGSPVARRIEHRVSGADANPYLVLASVLGSALIGIEKQQMPPAATDGNAYDSSTAEEIPCVWIDAIDAFADSDMMKAVFNEELCNVFQACKRQELKRFNQEVTSFEYQTYLETV